jgi:hypothetical protein
MKMQKILFWIVGGRDQLILELNKEPFEDVQRARRAHAVVRLATDSFKLHLERPRLRDRHTGLG